MNRLSEFASAIKAHEGWFVGSRSYRNNSPGNLRWSKYQAGIRDGYAYFLTYQQGWDALIFDIRAKCTGNTKTELGPDSTILEFCEVWAPSFDGNRPRQYAEFIASRLNLSIYSTLKEIYSERVPLKILVLLANLPVDRESVVKEGFDAVAAYFGSLGVDTTVDYKSGTWLTNPIMIKGATGENLDIIKDIWVRDPASVKNIAKPFIQGHHLTMYCYHTELGGTPTEFSEVFMGSVIGQLPVLDVSDSQWVSMFASHELMHGLFHRLNAEILLSKDYVHQKTWKDGYGEIMKSLLPLLPVILLPIQDKPYTPYIPPMTEEARMNFIVKFIYEMARIIKNWNSSFQ